MESFRADILKSAGIKDVFVQDNHSLSKKGVVRGLHFQWNPPMAKLMRVTSGSGFCVSVDIRIGSPTFGLWHGLVINAKNKLQVFAPAGFARGFVALENNTEVQYKCTGIHNSHGESGILWNDPDIGIKWPLKKVILSDKDKNAQTLKDWMVRKESRKFIWKKI